jgi:hypothetical protein
MTLGNMRMIIGLVLAIVLTSCKETSTRVVNLACFGTSREVVVSDRAKSSWPWPLDDKPERDTFSIQIDLDKKTVSIDGSIPYEIWNNDENTVTFKGEDSSTHGSINRITGVAQIWESYSWSGGSGPDVVYVTEGTCKSVGKLF